MKKGIIDVIKCNRKFYLLEAAGIGGFVLLAGAFTIFFEHPFFPVMKTWLWQYPFLRRAGLGIIMGLYILLSTKLFGKLSGMHVNPAVTWTFFRLNNIHWVDALAYVIAQFAGAIIAFYILKTAAGFWFGYPSIDYGVSKPQPPHTLAGAFVAEFLISFLLISVILVLSSSKKGEKYIPYSTGLLIAVFIAFELPYSGMSMNPARSFAAALGTNQWGELWVYFAAPLLAMLAAAELFTIWKRRRIQALHPDHREIDNYPMSTDS